MQNFKNVLKQAVYYQYYTYKDIKLLLVSDHNSIISIIWQCEFNQAHEYLYTYKEESNHIISTLKDQLDQYFSGNLKYFSISTKLIGTDFQKKLWLNLAKVSYGKTITYEDLAKKVFGKSYLRAISANIGRNPIPIIYPCHRIVAKQLFQGGFAGGIEIKEYLLQQELHYYNKSKGNI